VFYRLETTKLLQKRKEECPDNYKNCPKSSKEICSFSLILHPETFGSLYRATVVNYSRPNTTTIVQSSQYFTRWESAHSFDKSTEVFKS